jgi:hypothetical protein
MPRVLAEQTLQDPLFAEGFEDTKLAIRGCKATPTRKTIRESGSL